MCQLGNVRKTKSCRATFDRMRATENSVEFFVIGFVQVQIEQHLLHLVEVLTGFFKEDLVELGQVEIGFCPALMCIRHLGSYLFPSIRLNWC